ncbi:uncharacterized protein BKA78DRAFT_67382 [Phyllosticta capitalensis]|uniref:uncharacterized protein n=1 Tax=Phyllosticta capitalensis TaxID=121624 RepID=UPI0031316BCC
MPLRRAAVLTTRTPADYSDARRYLCLCADAPLSRNTSLNKKQSCSDDGETPATVAPTAPPTDRATSSRPRSNSWARFFDISLNRKHAEDWPSREHPSPNYAISRPRDQGRRLAQDRRLLEPATKRMNKRRQDEGHFKNAKGVVVVKACTTPSRMSDERTGAVRMSSTRILKS